ncbi:hypothetical protein EV363DRAFT_1172410 [Boletus edulis]|nr:hypothetical protein EV363DRAFT_1172410 [Boletus edulis]
MPKKEKIFHPDSRKAAQLARTHFRKSKLAQATIKRSKKYALQADVYGFFFHALPPVGVPTLEELHALVRDVWLTRHDDELEQERAARRKGRPKSTREEKLEEIKLKEKEEYRTGFEVPDLTHEPTVQFLRQWDQKEIAYVQSLRFIRISSADPTVAVVSKPGRHRSLLVDHTSSQHRDQEMSVDENYSILSEPPSRFASTITTMDGPL